MLISSCWHRLCHWRKMVHTFRILWPLFFWSTEFVAKKNVGSSLWFIWTTDQLLSMCSSLSREQIEHYSTDTHNTLGSNYIVMTMLQHIPMLHHLHNTASLTQHSLTYATQPDWPANIPADGMRMEKSIYQTIFPLCGKNCPGLVCLRSHRCSGRAVVGVYFRMAWSSWWIHHLWVHFRRLQCAYCVVRV